MLLARAIVERHNEAPRIASDAARTLTLLRHRRLSFFLSLCSALQRANVRMLRGSSLRLPPGKRPGLLPGGIVQGRIVVHEGKVVGVTDVVQCPSATIPAAKTVSCSGSLRRFCSPRTASGVARCTHPASDCEEPHRQRFCAHTRTQQEIVALFIHWSGIQWHLHHVARSAPLSSGVGRLAISIAAV
jgi:hypothetical protein